MVGKSGLLIGFAAPDALAASLAGQRLLDPLFFAGLEKKGVFLDFLNNVFLLDSPLEAAERVFQRLPFLESYFGHKPHPLAV